MAVPSDVYNPGTGGPMFSKLASDIRERDAQTPDPAAAAASEQSASPEEQGVVSEGAGPGAPGSGGPGPVGSGGPGPVGSGGPEEPMQDFAGGSTDPQSLEGFAQQAMWSDANPQKWGGRGGYQYDYTPGNPEKGIAATMTVHGGPKNMIPRTIDESSQYWKPIMDEMFEMDAKDQLQPYISPPKDQTAEDIETAAADKQAAQEASQSVEASPGATDTAPAVEATQAPSQALPQTNEHLGSGTGLSDADIMALFSPPAEEPPPAAENPAPVEGSPVPEDPDTTPEVAAPEAAPPTSPGGQIDDSVLRGIAKLLIGAGNERPVDPRIAQQRMQEVSQRGAANAQGQFNEVVTHAPDQTTMEQGNAERAAGAQEAVGSDYAESMLPHLYKAMNEGNAAEVERMGQMLIAQDPSIEPFISGMKSTMLNRGVK